MEVKGLDLNYPDGTALLRGVSFVVAKGERLLITGPNGTGKSTLLRAIAIIWPFTRGEIRLGEGRIFFIGQRPYLPLSTLAEALVYPSTKTDSFPQSRLAAALEEVGLGALASELDVLEQWPQRLSPGEQQRLAFARVLLAKPACVFLDEATSSVDTAAEARLYGLLRAATWHPVVVSVGHSEALPKFHDRVLDLAAFQPEQVK